MVMTKNKMIACRGWSESAMLEELSLYHSYMYIELANKRERETMSFSRNKKTGKVTIEPAVCIRLSVPEKSKLGKKIIEMRKVKSDTKDKKKRTKR